LTCLKKKTKTCPQNTIGLKRKDVFCGSMIRLLNLAMVIGLLPELLKESKMVITLLDSKRLEKMENYSLERHPICVMNLHLGLNTLWNVRQKENMKIQQFSVLVLSIKNLLTD